MRSLGRLVSLLLFLSGLEVATSLSSRRPLHSWLNKYNVKCGSANINTGNTYLHKISRGGDKVPVSLALRGGKIHSAHEHDRYEQEDEGYDSDEDIDNEELNGTPFIGGIKLTIPPVVVDTWRSTPPVTRAFLTASLILAVLSNLFNDNNFPQILEMNVNDVVQKLQLWRPFTAFLYLGPLGLGYLLTLQFLWTYMGQVEKLQYDRPEKFIVMLLFGAFNLLLGFGMLGIPTQGLGHNLSSFFVYIWSRLFEGVDVNLMNIVTVQAEMLPWIFCLQTLLLEQAFPVADLLGIFIGHLYLYADSTHWEGLQSVTDSVKPLLSAGFRDMYSPFKKHFETSS